MVFNTMPRTKKSSEAGGLSELHRKVLLRCRMLLLRDLDVAEILDHMAVDDAFKPEVCEQILRPLLREQRVGHFLDRLENRTDKTFLLFMEALKEHYKHLHYVMEECMRNIQRDDKNEPQHREKVALSGEAVRKLLRKGYRKMTTSQGSRESGEGSTDAEHLLDEKDDEEYIDCYAIPMRGHLQKESWIKHVSLQKTEVDNITPAPTTFTATLLKSMAFTRVDLRDIPKELRKPPPHCNIYVMENETNTHAECDFINDNTCLPSKHQLDLTQLSALEITMKEKEDDIPSLEPPPPVPPKPDNLPPISHHTLSMTPRSKSDDSDHEAPAELRPPPRVSSLAKPEKSKIPPRPLPKPRLEGSPVRQMISVFEPGNKLTRHSSHKILASQQVPYLHRRASLNEGRDLEVVKDLENSCDVAQSIIPETVQATDNDMDILSPIESDFPVDIEECPDSPSIIEPTSSTLSTTNDDTTLEGVNEVYISSSCSTLSTVTLAADNCNPSNISAITPVTTDPEANKLNSEGKYEPVTPTEIDSDSPLAGNIPPPTADTDDYVLEPEDVIPDYGDAYPLSDVSTRKCLSRESTPIDVSSPINDESAKASGGSMDSRSSLAAVESIEEQSTVTTDSGVDISAGHTVILRTGSKKTSRPSTIISRSLAEDVLASDHSSTSDDSYYEDIDLLDTCHSPSLRSNATYLDPKSYGLKGFERHSRNGERSRLLNIGEIDSPKRLVLNKGEQLIAEFAPVATDEEVASIQDSKLNCQVCFQNSCIVFDKDGNAIYIPKHFLKKFGDPHGEAWFYPIPITSRQATLFLAAEKQEGCFIVYEPCSSTSNAKYNLSVCRAEGDVVHYHIVENIQGDVMIEGHGHSFMTILDLVKYFRRNKSQLATRLRRTLKEAKLPITPGYHYDAKYEINKSSLNLSGKIIGKGHFGIVCAGEYKGSSVAVKVLQRADMGTVEEDEFMEEAKVMMGLKDEHILRLVGVSCSTKPFFIVTELVARGSLRECLKNRTLPTDSIDTLFDLCIQTTAALYYLETQRYVLHRDVAARNFLITADMCVKLADFGRARFVNDDHYQAQKTEKISIKWAAPEVLIASDYSTKSDVWSLGIVYWEIFSGGERPYSTLNSEHTVMYILEGGRLDKPPGCTPDLYNMMMTCWQEDPADRPSATALYDKLKSKTSIYYTPSVRVEKSLSMPQGVSPISSRNPLSPMSPGRSLSATLPPKVPKSRRKTVHEFAKTQSFIESPEHGKHLFVEGFPSSSSEISLSSTSGMTEELGRDGIIRKSLRKIGVMKSKKKQFIKGDHSKDIPEYEPKLSPGPM